LTSQTIADVYLVNLKGLEPTIVPTILPPVSTAPAVSVARFSKKFEMTRMLLSGPWGNMIHEKNLKQKIS
jgi:hypothetical protein